MPERSSIAQVSQIGKEATPGTAVAATKRLGSISITPSINVETDPFRPTGVKFNTVVTLNREWTDIAYEGNPTYDEVIYPLAAVMGTPLVTEVVGEGLYEWTFKPSSVSPDVPATFTLESGQAGVGVEKYAHMMLTGFGMEVSRTEVGMSGAGFARALTRGPGVTLTPALPVPTDLVPIQPGHFSVYLGADPADLGVTDGDSGGALDRLTRVISVSPSVEDRFNPAWFVNGAEGSFTTFVENADGVGGGTGLTVEADAAGMTWLDRLHNGDTAYLRVEAVGPVVAGATLPLLFQWDMPVKVEGTESFSDEDGIYAIGWNLVPVHDAAFDGATRVKVRNTVAAL